MNALCSDPLTLAYHELRSPLGLLATAVRSVAEDSGDDALRGRCELIVRTVERMLRTTERVFGIARAGEPEAGEWFAPAEIVEQLVRDLRGMDVQVDIRAGAATGSVREFGARGVFETLVQSLVSNAVDHGEPGTVIRVELDADGETLALDITNRIAARRRHDGLGAGLYLAGRLAEQLGGVLTAEADGLEYRASLRLPLRRSDQAVSM